VLKPNALLNFASKLLDWVRTAKNLGQKRIGINTHTSASLSPHQRSEAASLRTFNESLFIR
jgi:hypothetical protein